MQRHLSGLLQFLDLQLEQFLIQTRELVCIKRKESLLQSNTLIILGHMRHKTTLLAKEHRCVLLNQYLCCYMLTDDANFQVVKASAKVHNNQVEIFLAICNIHIDVFTWCSWWRKSVNFPRPASICSTLHLQYKTKLDGGYNHNLIYNTSVQWVYDRPTSLNVNIGSKHFLDQIIDVHLLLSPHNESVYIVLKLIIYRVCIGV